MALIPIAPAFTDPSPLELPLFVSRIRAGFPSPADDFMDDPLDLNKFLVKRPAATYFVRVEGDSLQDINIHDGDLLIVDRSAKQSHGSVVVAAIDGEMTCKILDKKGKKLLPANKDFKPIDIADRDDVVIVGVVMHSIKCHLK